MLGGFIGLASQRLPLAPMTRSLVVVGAAFLASWHISLSAAFMFAARRSATTGVGAVSSGPAEILFALLILVVLVPVSSVFHFVLGRSSHLAPYRTVLVGILGGASGPLLLAPLFP